MGNPIDSSMNNQISQTYSPERLAYWYFRINGFLTIENFIVHPDSGSDQRTDADLLAVRFAHRAENIQDPMIDDPKIVVCSTYANVIIAEIKTGVCSLNEPWTRQADGNLGRVLRAVGCVPEGLIDHACHDLYRIGRWSDYTATFRLYAVGDKRDKTLSIPEGQQLIWDDVITFIVARFKLYQQQKSSVGQWSNDGRQLKTLALRSAPNTQIRRMFGLQERPSERE